jgi:hypothetical protein
MAQNTGTFTVEDYDREKSSSSFNIGPLTAGNFVAKRAALDALKTAIDGIIIGEIRKTTISEQFSESVAAVTDKNAQRESKWLVTYRDETQFLDVGNTINNVGYGNLYSVELPTADLSLLGNNQDALDIDPLTRAAVVTAFITAFEAVQNSPTGGNDVTVVSIRHVGRST